MNILAIETSCDESSIALVECSGGIKTPRFRVLHNLVASQIKVHRPFGGVVPGLAKREHVKNLPRLWKQLKARSPARFESRSESGGSKLKADVIAVTVGPGLEPALWTGIEFAKDLAKKLKKPLVGANHLEGHLYSFLLAKKLEAKSSNLKALFPAIGLIVSGGHTTLLLLKNLTSRKKLGETRDDAVGEAFDKVARILGLPYPGGPEIERVARRGNPRAIEFPRPMIGQKNYDFSFSGLKTAVFYYVQENPLSAKSSKLKANVAASFQKAAVDVLLKKTMRAASEFGAKSILLSGGVASNKLLRKTLARSAKETGRKFFVADYEYNTDNAAMIAVAAYINYFNHKKYPLRANGALNIN